MISSRRNGAVPTALHISIVRSKFTLTGSSFEGGRGWGVKRIVGNRNCASSVEEKIYFAKVRRKIRHAIIKSLISHDIVAPQWRGSHRSPYF
ncbi:MAG TPA: hypothetical protein VGG77_00280, partial [Roseiarcus sp.]